jgi:hypothetical protein
VCSRLCSLLCSRLCSLLCCSLRGVSVLVTFFVFSFVLLFRWCECSCDTHVCSLHSAYANVMTNTQRFTLHQSTRFYDQYATLLLTTGTADATSASSIVVVVILVLIISAHSFNQRVSHKHYDQPTRSRAIAECSGVTFVKRWSSSNRHTQLYYSLQAQRLCTYAHIPHTPHVSPAHTHFHHKPQLYYALQAQRMRRRRLHACETHVD